MSVPLTRTFIHRLIYFIDRRSQLMCSTARVVPVGISTDDEPSLADDNEEDFLTSGPGTRTPRGAFAGDLDWDEDESFMPTYTSLQQPLHAPNDSHREVQAPTFRGHESVDERSPLLSRVAEQSSAPRHAPSSVPTKPSPVGQSTFSQTVSRRVCLFSVSQAHGGPTWFGQLFNATALLLGIGMLSEPLAFSYAGWICGTLLIVLYGMFTCYTYVIAIGVLTSLMSNFFLEGQNFWRALSSLIRVFVPMQTSGERRSECVPCRS
jgi:hypothetical protein